MQNGATNYQREFNKIVMEAEQAGIKPSVLLHCCCAPCSSYVLSFLSPIFEVTGYFYNPNIFPEEEYQRRKNEFSKLFMKAEYKDEIFFLEGEYHPNIFYDVVKGYELFKEGQDRCLRCFALRLQMTATMAKQMNYDYFTTTLTISPHKNAKNINEIGELVARQVGIKWLPSDFKKNNGYIKSIEFCKEYGLYRQSYCGCEFSFSEGMSSWNEQ